MTARHAQRLATGIGLLAAVLLAALTIDNLAFAHAVAQHGGLR